MAKAQGYLFANISVTMITMLINLLAAITILRTERTSVHLLIVNDCVVNVLSSLLTRASQSDPRSESCNPFLSDPCVIIFFLSLSVTNYVTNCCLVYFIDVTLADEDSSSMLADGHTCTIMVSCNAMIAEVWSRFWKWILDRVRSRLWPRSFVDILRLKFSWDFEAELW